MKIPQTADDNNNSNGGGLSIAAILGICAGVIALLALILFIAIGVLIAL